MTDLDKVVSKIETLVSRKTPILVAIDGRSGAGKSTISKKIAGQVNGTVVVGDDFFSGGSDDEWNKLSQKEKVNKCIDWERLRNEVLEPLLAGNSASWHPFDFKTGIGLSQQTITAEPSDIILLDGAYSSRHELTDLIDISILVEAERVVRKKRLVKREGTTFMDSWHRVWDLAEDYYFIHIRPKESFDFVVKN